LKEFWKLFQNYFSESERFGKYSSPGIYACETISGKFPCAEIKLLTTIILLLKLLTSMKAKIIFK